MTTLREIETYIGTGERSYWSIVARFTDADTGRTLAAGLESGTLTRRQTPDGWIYKLGFPGVDIDAVHRRKS